MYIRSNEDDKIKTFRLRIIKKFCFDNKILINPYAVQAAYNDNCLTSLISAQQVKQIKDNELNTIQAFAASHFWIAHRENVAYFSFHVAYSASICAQIDYIKKFPFVVLR